MQSLYFQVLGVGVSGFQIVAEVRIAPMGSFVVLALTSRTRRLTVVISVEKVAEKTGITLE